MHTLSIALRLLAALAPLSPPAVTSQDEAPPAPPDPSQGEVALPSLSDGWQARLVIDNGETGIWTVESFQVFEVYGSPEVVGLDDEGRCHVLVSYSGKWTPVTRVGDGKWLGGLAHGDVDPRVPGAELYTGGQLGNLYQLVPSPQGSHGALDARLIAHLPGRELHTLVAGDLDPRSLGSELLVFTRPGALYRVSADGQHGTFRTELLQELPGRVRDAVVLPSEGPGRPPTVATVTRAGTLSLLDFDDAGPHWSVVYEDAMGMGRLALAPPAQGRGPVLYSTCDDGRILRHERGAGGAWRSETIYAGPQGPRGVAAGPFCADPAVESVAVFGYSRKVQLLTRAEGGPWSVETLFEDRDKGHWLAAAELDGRNGTREIIGSGYGARIFMLARPPGYGLDGVLTEPPDAPRRVPAEALAADD